MKSSGMQNIVESWKAFMEPCFYPIAKDAPQIGPFLFRNSESPSSSLCQELEETNVLNFNTMRPILILLIAYVILFAGILLWAVMQ